MTPDCLDPNESVQPTSIVDSIDNRLRSARVQLGSILSEPRSRVKFTLDLLNKLGQAVDTIDAARMHLKSR